MEQREKDNVTKCAADCFWITLYKREYPFFFFRNVTFVLAASICETKQTETCKFIILPTIYNYRKISKAFYKIMKIIVGKMNKQTDTLTYRRKYNINWIWQIKWQIFFQFITLLMPFGLWGMFITTIHFRVMKQRHQLSKQFDKCHT